MGGRSRALVLCLAASAMARPTIAQDEIFLNSFDEPEVCGWSKGFTQCVGRADVEDLLNDSVEFPFCLEPSPSSDGTVTYCSSGLCNGVPGCPATLRIVPGSVVLDPPVPIFMENRFSLDFSFDITIDDLDLPALIPLAGECLVETSGISGGESLAVLRFLACPTLFPDALMALGFSQGVEVLLWSIDALTGNVLCSLVSDPLPDFGLYLSDQVREPIERFLEAELLKPFCRESSE
jgi:hypothetical protein